MAIPPSDIQAFTAASNQTGKREAIKKRSSNKKEGDIRIDQALNELHQDEMVEATDFEDYSTIGDNEEHNSASRRKGKRGNVSLPPPQNQKVVKDPSVGQNIDLKG